MGERVAFLALLYKHVQDPLFLVGLSHEAFLQQWQSLERHTACWAMLKLIRW